MRDPYSNDQLKSSETRVGEGVQQVTQRVGEVAEDVTTQVKLHPYTTVAIAAGLAFAVGALWKMRGRAQQSPLEQWMASLPQLPSASTMRSYWR